MTPAELFRETIKPDGKPDRLLKQYEGMKFIFGNPVSEYIGGVKRGETAKDKWGVTKTFEENAPGPMPVINDELKVLKDITHWQDYVHAPDIANNCQDGWESCQKAAKEINDEGYLSAFVMGTGIFEQCHYLMGFEDTLTNLYEHPAEMHELIDYILDFRMRYAKLLIDNVHPDVILSHDDWGTKDALFMKRDMWREFFKEPYRKFYSYMKSEGVIVIHHADSYCADIVDDMVEIGIDVWQGVLPENDIPTLLHHLQGKMVLMGGIGAAIDTPVSTESEIYTYTKNLLNECAPYGGFIPCITYGLPGAIYKHVDAVIDRTIDEYNSVLHAREFRSTKPVRRRKIAVVESGKETSAIEEKKSTDSAVLSEIAENLRKGRKNRVVKRVEKALNDGIDPQEILSRGLVAGMIMVGDDFSQNKVFIPEMLMAARCMNAATDILKPYLVNTDSTGKGKVCIGTVKGDTHDIGKNLVRIMMEGYGLTVIDLGVDVPAEKFIETAINEKCDIICCSALLTTTMAEMKKIVDLAKTSGIRDKVIIQIGGAPITQKFCDEIGADIYTADAARAARRAVRAIENK